MEPRNFSIVKSAISKGMLLDMEYTDGAGRIQRKLVAPDKIFVDEGVYYVAVWTDVSNAAPADKMKFVKTDTTINKATGKPRIWQVLRISRIEHAELVEPTEKVDLPDVPASELRKWSFDNGTPAVFITNQDDLSFIDSPVGSHRREMRRRREGASDCVFRFLVCRVLHRARPSYYCRRAGDVAYDDHRPSTA